VNAVDPSGEQVAGTLAVGGTLALIDGPLPVGDLLAIIIIGGLVVSTIICFAKGSDDPWKDRLREKEHGRRKYEGRRKAKDELRRRIEQGDEGPKPRPKYDQPWNIPDEDLPPDFLPPGAVYCRSEHRTQDLYLTSHRVHSIPQELGKRLCLGNGLQRH
jgi:hypothetical protein